ncbi:hypothetical protein WA026_001378 [Henosepilachna vigintioctopunctata]
MGTKMRNDFSDEEDDLEALRLAALSSLKKKNELNGYVQNEHISKEKTFIHNKTSFRGKRRFFSGQTGRGRNNQFNNQVRNSNLISIPTVNAENDICLPIQKSLANLKKENDVPKLIRPQDRYAYNINDEIGREGPSSKFDRYNNSNSESEEEDEISSTKLGRSDSLEALMEELDAEIQGEPKKDKKEKLKIKKDTKTEQSKESGADNINGNELKVKVNEQNEQVIRKIETQGDPIDSTCKQLEETEVSKKVEIKHEMVDISNPTSKTQGVHQIQRSPIRKKMSNRKVNGRIFNSEHPFVPIMIPNPSFVTTIQPPQFTTVYNTVPSFTGTEVFSLTVPPPTFVPPPNLRTHMMPSDIPPAGYNITQLPPLVIEPSSNLPSIPMGPLSPRSAAFVLQNRAIVEKRKRSPRRSYSRSPSPPTHRLRYSKSPPQRRSLTPLRRLSPLRRSFSPSRRSLSPRRSPLRRSLSPYRRHREKSPRKESPRRSPRRTRESPIKSPKRSKDSPKKIRDIRRTPIKDRLGARSKTDEKDKKKEIPTSSSPSKKEEKKPLDPVLEARKRKFESKEMKVKEGVIRLKPKDEKLKDENKLKDEKLVEEIKVEKKIDVIKLNVEVIENVNVEANGKPLTEEESTKVISKKEVKYPLGESPKRDQLEEAMNELEMLLKDDEALELTAKVDELFTDEETDQENEGRFNFKKSLPSDNNFTRKVNNGMTKKPFEKKRENKSKWNFDETRKEPKSKSKKEPLTNPIENRKIEIKIRNPGKYEKCSNKVQVPIIKTSPERKVELDKKEEFSGDETEPEIIVENEGDNEDIEDVATSREGDLRAQLSRKRAERQNKLAKVGGFQSRLLQSALEGAVFKKKKSKKKDRESKDVKLPIHLRLGIAHDSNIFAEAATEKISRRKSKKRKHAIVDQV